MISFKLLFSKEEIIGYETHVNRRTGAKTSPIVRDLGKKSESCYRTQNLSFFNRAAHQKTK